MTKILSINEVEITQKNFQQVLIRGDGKEKFNQIINMKYLYYHHQKIRNSE